MKKLSILSKLTPVICFLCVFLEAYIINITGAASQYEVSIYSAYPIYFWILLIIVLFLTFLNIFFLVEKKTNYTSVILTIFASINSLVIFLLLPLFRNYYFYNPFDSLTHLGYVNDIFMSGHFGSTNYYPFLHIFIYSISIFSRVDPRLVMFFIPLFFNLFFIVSMFIFVRSITVKKEMALILTAFAILPVFTGSTSYVTPEGMTFLLIPIFLFLFLKSRTTESNWGTYSILMIVFLLILPVFHMEVAVILIISLLLLFLYFKFRNSGNWIGHDEGILKDLKLFIPNLKLLIKRNSYLELEIMLIILLTWFSSTFIFGLTIKELYYSLFYTIETSSASILQTSSLTSTAIIYDIIKIFGVDLFFISIAGLIILYILFSKNRKFGPIYGPLTLIYIAMVILNFLTFFKNLIVGTRIAKYLVLISIFIISIVLYNLVNSTKTSITLFTPLNSAYSSIRDKANFLASPIFKLLNRVGSRIFISLATNPTGVKTPKFNRSYLISIALIPIIVLTVFTAYPSPALVDVNLQVTEQAFDGYSFFIHYKENLTTLSYPDTPQTFQNAILGSNTQYTDEIQVLKPVDNFGYSNNLTKSSNNFGSTGSTSLSEMKLLVGHIGNFYPNDAYLIMDDVTKYSNAYSTDDFAKLESDDTANKVYDSGGFSLYYIVHPTFSP